MGIRSMWVTLSVSKKLYIVVGVMGVLIAIELFTLRFAMNTLSSVRAFVGAEGLWSKAQKAAVLHLHKYAESGNVGHYNNFFTSLEVPLGDRQARTELYKKNPNYEKIREGFIRGRIHPDDIDGLVVLVRRFHWVPQLAQPLAIWEEGDRLLDEFMLLGEVLHQQILKKTPKAELDATLAEIDKVNHLLTKLEDDFSFSLGEGSRWLEGLLMMVLLLAVITIEGTGLWLTFTFSRGLSKSLNELCEAANKIGQGVFKERVEVRSKDELGRLAGALNQMAANLESHIGEKNRAVQKDQEKSLFLANMSHEIRTPLGAILGFADLLRDPDLSEKERVHYAEIIHRTGTNLSKVINEILDLSKIEAGRIEIYKTKFSLKEMLQQIREVMQIRLQEKTIHLKIEFIGEEVDYIFTDPMRLRQILTNLLGNAIKFTDIGHIHLKVEPVEDVLKFWIKDTGIGVTEEQSKILFQTFTQIDSSTSRKYEGTGLGLALSKKLAGLLGGDVQLVESIPNRGSLFLVTIELDRGAGTSMTRSTHTISENDKTYLNGKTALIVEDIKENQVLLDIMLTKIGAKTVIASNGQEAVDAIKKTDFDFIIMDIQMPIMDGYEAVKQIRAYGYKKPIIALTAHAMKEDKVHCLEVGFTSYLAKPMDMRELLETLKVVM